jgi:hypothetical protein
LQHTPHDDLATWSDESELLTSEADFTELVLLRNLEVREPCRLCACWPAGERTGQMLLAMYHNSIWRVADLPVLHEQAGGQCRGHYSAHARRYGRPGGHRARSR